MGGFAVAASAISLMLALAPPAIPRLEEIAVTPQFAIATTAVATVVGLLLWVLSASGNRLSIVALTAGGRQAGSRWATRTRSAIMVGQVAFCVALLLVSAMVVRSFVALQRAPNGFDSGGVLSAQIRHPIMKPGEIVKHYPTRRPADTTPGRSRAAVTISLVSRASSIRDFRRAPQPVAGLPR